MSQYLELSFKEVQQDFLHCIQIITGKKVMDLSTAPRWENDAKRSEINQEILDNLDDILFLKGYRNPVMLYKKLNYLITISIAHKFAPDPLRDYIENNISLEELEEQLPFADSNMLDMYLEQLVLDYDSIKIIDDEEEVELNDNDDNPQSNGNDGTLALGLSYIKYQYDPENNKNNSESTLKELAGLFDEIISRVFENGEISLRFNNDLIFRYYLHSDKDNIHIRFNADLNSGKVTILNPVTEQPMNIDIFTDWWKI